MQDRLSLFDDVVGTSVGPALLDVFADAQRWRYWEAYLEGESVEVVLHAGPIETRIDETAERERKVRQRRLMFTSDPHDEIHPGLAEVHKQGVFLAPTGELWSVVDDDLDTRTPSLIRVLVQFARIVKFDHHAELFG